VTAQSRPASTGDLLGHRAGAVSRIGAAVIDFAVVTLLGVGALLAAAFVRYLVVGAPFETPTLPQWLSATAGTAIALGYLAYFWATTGRTIGMQVFGLRLLGRSGRPLRPAPALLRAALCLVFPAGLLWVLVSRRNASLQDLVLRTTVVYDSTYGPPGGRGTSGPPGGGRSEGSAGGHGGRQERPVPDEVR
jgi:uncharacterized RDD family membrane protein YckC